MRGMRNIVAHDYANVDVTVIWDVATLHVTQLIAVLAPFLDATPSRIVNKATGDEPA